MIISVLLDMGIKMTIIWQQNDLNQHLIHKAIIKDTQTGISRALN